MENEAKESIFDVLKNLIPLFAVEIVLLTVMNFANLSVVYRYLAIFLMIIAFMQIIKVLPKSRAIIPLFIQIGGLLLFEFISISFGWFSVFNTGVQGSLFSSILIIISIIFGGVAFYIIGGYYGLFHKNNLDITKLIAVFYTGIGIYVLICLIATIYGMGTAFHTIVFANPNRENAWAFVKLTQQARILIGFNTVLRDDGVLMLGNMALISSTGLLAVFFIDRKKNPLFFYGSLIGGACGLLPIILFPLVFDLAIFIFALVLVILIKLLIKHKKIALITFFAVFGILAISYFIFRIDLHNHADKYKDMNYIIKELLTRNIGVISNISATKLLINHLPAFVGSSYQKNIYLGTGTFVLNIVYQNGILALLCLLAFFIVAGIELVKFCKTYDNNAVKIVMISLFVSYLGTILVNDIGFPLIEDFVFLGLLVLLGYVTAYNIEHKKALESKND